MQVYQQCRLRVSYQNMRLIRTKPLMILLLSGGITDSDVNDSCCNECQYQSSTHQCRPASTSCDVPEYCTGSSGSCPPDVFTLDGTDCGNNLKCASGQCTSRTLQCRHRGFTLNVTQACSSSNSCSLSCNKPSGSGCLVFSGGMIDGTPCGGNGVCKNGDCDEGSICKEEQQSIPFLLFLTLLPI